MTVKEINERIEELKNHITLVKTVAALTSEEYRKALNDAISQMERRLREYENACWIMGPKEEF